MTTNSLAEETCNKAMCENEKNLSSPEFLANYNPDYHPDDYQFLWRSGRILTEKLNKMHECWVLMNNFEEGQSFLE